MNTTKGENKKKPLCQRCKKALRCIKADETNTFKGGRKYHSTCYKMECEDAYQKFLWEKYNKTPWKGESFVVCFD